jgi:hypothetical protein
MANRDAAAPTPQELAAQAARYNGAARQHIMAACTRAVQSIYTTTFVPGAQPTVLTIVPRPVGILRRFIVETTVTGTTAGAQTLTRSPFGPANLWSQVGFWDLSNYQRVNTTGLHLAWLATVRRAGGAVTGAAFTTDTPLGFGSNYTPVQAPATVAATTPWTVNMIHVIPLQYGDFDLRGAIYAGVINSVTNLQLTFNPNFFMTGTDTILSCFTYTGAVPTITSVVVNVYQEFYDQVPQTPHGPLLPTMDMDWAYLLNNSVMTGIVTGQSFPIPFANFRDYMSRMLIYDNGGTLNAGTDITNFQLQAANLMNIWQEDTVIRSFRTRELLGDDFPKGTYYFNFRDRPINTIQYGNMQLIVNPTGTVNAGAQFQFFDETLAKQNQVVAAGSMPAS